MRRPVLAIGISLLAAVIYLGCGAGGDSEGGNVGNLQGTWFGVLEDDSGTLETFSIEIDGSGNVVDVKIGGVSTGNTGFINEDWDEHLFYFFLDSPSGNPPYGGIMIVDSSFHYAIYGESGPFIAVLEKGAVSLPSYASSDIVGNYSGGGYEFAYDPVDDIWTWGGDPVSMAVNQSLIFSGSAPGESFSGDFDPTLRSSTYGGYVGSVHSSRPIDLDIKALVSPDKKFVAAYAAEIGTTPSDIGSYILIGLVK